MEVLKVRFELLNLNNLIGKLDFFGIDVFVFIVDVEKEFLLVIVNIIFLILLVDYFVEKFFCYFFDDGGLFLMFEVMVEVVSFVKIWVFFCRKYKVELWNLESYFGLKKDFYKGKVRYDFVREWRYVKRGYEEFKVWVNVLFYLIRRRFDVFNSKEEIKVLEKWKNWKVKVEED